MLNDFDSLGIQLANINPNARELVGKYKGKELLIVGSGRCVWDDLEQIDYKRFDIMCINDIVMHFPDVVEHMYSNDHHMLGNWVNARRPMVKRNDPRPIKIHSCQVGGTYTWPWPGHGSSGLNACYTGVALGYDKIVLAGLPLDNSGHYFDPSWRETNFNNEVPNTDRGHPRYWENANRYIFKGRVKSLSGRTKELLGGL